MNGRGTPRPEILLAEDQEALMRTLVLSLASLPVHVSGHCLPELAEECARGRRVDLLVTDIDMPGMNGYDLAARVRERWPDARVLFITGRADAGPLLDSHGFGGAACLKKPFGLDEFCGTVADKLGLEWAPAAQPA